jgi:hypothetical protein
VSSIDRPWKQRNIKILSQTMKQRHEEISGTNSRELVSHQKEDQDQWHLNCSSIFHADRVSQNNQRLISFKAIFAHALDCLTTSVSFSPAAYFLFGPPDATHLLYCSAKATTYTRSIFPRSPSTRSLSTDSSTLLWIAYHRVEVFISYTLSFESPIAFDTYRD